MVARPPLRLRIEPMRIEDLVVVHAIERASFAAPWPANAYRSELETNRLAHYLVARVEDEIVGYGGMWLMVDEAHITTFAIHPAWRRQRIGERLLLAFLDLAVDRRAREATLEVRLSNLPARRLYEKYGFKPVGLRPRYYSDDGEDALIMTTEALTGPIDARADRAPARRARCLAGPGPSRRPGRSPGCGRDPGRPGRPRWRRGVSGPLVLAIESSCDETGIALIEDGRTIRSNVVASQVALHAASGGIVPEVAARAHLRWIVPVLDAAWADAGAAWSDDRRRGRDLRSRAGRLAARRHQPRQGARLGPREAARSGSTTSRATCTRPGSPTGQTEHVEPVFPLVALVVSGGHTFLAEMTRPSHLPRCSAPPSTTRRARRSTRSAACSASAIRAAPRSRRRPRARRSATASSRGRGWAIRSTSASPGSRRPPGVSSPRRAREAGLADDPEAALPPEIVAELAWGFQDAVVDVLATKTIRAARAIGARSIVLGGGVAANTALRARLAGEADELGIPLIVPAAGPVHGQRRDDRGGRRASVRGGRPVRPRPRRPPVAAARGTGRRAASGQARPRLDPAEVRATLRAAGLRARHALSQNFLADPDVLEAILAEAAPRARAPRARDRPRPRAR